MYFFDAAVQPQRTRNIKSQIKYGLSQQTKLCSAGLGPETFSTERKILKGFIYKLTHIYP